LNDERGRGILDLSVAEEDPPNLVAEIFEARHGCVLGLVHGRRLVVRKKMNNGLCRGVGLLDLSSWLVSLIFNRELVT
jgi:hypothetical protein